MPSGASFSTGLDATMVLLERAQLGDERACGKLFQRYETMLQVLVRVRLSHPLRRRVDTMDVVQESFVAAWKRIREFRYEHEHSFRAWLVQIVVAQVQEIYRQHHLEGRSLQREVHADDPEMRVIAAQPDEARGTDPFLSTQQKLDAIMAMSRLGEADQILVCMHLFEGWSYAQTGEALGISRVLAKQRYDEAISRMSKGSAGEGPALQPATG